VRFSSSLMAMLRRSAPIITLSRAHSRSLCSTWGLALRAANNAAHGIAKRTKALLSQEELTLLVVMMPWRAGLAFADVYEIPADGRGAYHISSRRDEQTLKTTPPVGTGPFMYKSHQQNTNEEVVRNPDYFVKGKPYLDGKFITFLGDSAAVEAAFRAGQVDDPGQTWDNIKQAQQIEKDMGAKIKNITYPSTSGMAMLLNIHRDPFKDARVREAIYRAIDIDRILNVVFLGDGDKTWYFSNARPSRFPVGRKAVEQYVGYDPKKSADLLRAAGADLTKTYELMVPPEAQTWVDGGGLVAEDLQKVGFKLRVNPIVRNIYLQRAGPKPGDFDITMTVFLDYQYMKTESGTFWNNTSLEDPEVNALAEKIEATIDDQARAKLSNEVELMLAKKYSPLVPMLSTNLHGSYYAYLKGFDWEQTPGGLGGWQVGMWKDQA